MKFIKRLCRTALLSVMIVCFAACSFVGTSPSGNADGKQSTESGDATEKKEIASPDSLTLAFCLNDSLNPYTAKSEQNIRLSSLIYEPLISLDSSFKPVYRLARLVNGGSDRYSVMIRNGAMFSNGTHVTAEDVIYSFGLAKKSAKYKGCFGNVSSVYSENGNVIFKLKEADPNFANMLDFPIIPSGSTDKTGKTGRKEAPSGSGPYKYSYSTAEPKLVLNTGYNGADSPSIKEIKLYDTPDDESYRYAVAGGKVSVCYTTLSDDIVLPDSLSAKVNLNHMVYIGINSASPVLENSAVRRAINYCINRKDIIDSSYYEDALLPTGLENPAYKDSKLTDKEFFIQSFDNASKAMAEAGFTKKSDNGYYVNAKDTELSVRVLVNSENPQRVGAAKSVVENLAEMGIKAQVEKVSFETYNSQIKSKNYDLYIGEVLLPNNMSIASLINNKSQTANGVQGDNLYKKYKKMLSGDYKAADFMELFEKEVPFVPLAYRLGHMTYSRCISGVSTGVNDAFLSIGSWKYSSK